VPLRRDDEGRGWGVISDCRECGEPVLSDAERCPKCGADLGHGTSAGSRLGTSWDLWLERALLMLGLLGLLQIVKVFAAPDVPSWVQVARVAAGGLGIVFLLIYHKKDVSALSTPVKNALTAAVGVSGLLSVAIAMST
jgi:zinc-ribbon domain